MRALVVLLSAVLACACACAPPPDRSVRLERLAMERRALAQTLDRLEARLTSSRARVLYWERVRQERQAALEAYRASSGEQAETAAMGIRPPPAWLGGPRVAVAPSVEEAAGEGDGRR